MKRTAILVILAALLPPGGASLAHAQALRVRTAEGVVQLKAAWHERHPAYSLDAIEALGGAVAGERAGGATVVLFGDTLRFSTTSPFFVCCGEVYQMAWPVYRADGRTYVPRQFFVEWIPDHYSEQLVLRRGVLMPVALAEARPAKRIVIIDPGHGGRDPGRPGPGRLNEEQIVLMMSTHLAGVLRGRGYEVHLTRTRDTLIALSDRPHMANEWKAGRPTAVFISMHANAHRDENVRGFETYFLSEARTDDERRVAEMENAAVVYEQNGGRDVGDALSHVLNNLRNNFYVRASNDLAAAIQGELADVHPAPNRGVKQAGFRVLVGAFMPAVLVETAFLSNRRGAELLSSSRFRERIAVAIADAIDRFFRAHEYLSLNRSR